MKSRIKKKKQTTKLEDTRGFLSLFFFCTYIPQLWLSIFIRSLAWHASLPVVPAHIIVSVTPYGIVRFSAGEFLTYDVLQMSGICNGTLTSISTSEFASPVLGERWTKKQYIHLHRNFSVIVVSRNGFC
jgi:hypothetical protein